ncbi:MAG: threonine ammonia-lyase [Steroidobacteraceae bacterium]
MHAPTLEDIERASARISGHVTRTPCLHSRTLSRLTGAQIWIKFENLQFTASFKERGALNRLLQLRPEQRAVGVSAMSAGNHGQAVAYHATRLGIPSTIVMPRFTPYVKVEQTRLHGAEVILQGDTLSDAYDCVQELTQRRGLIFVHPYDDSAVIAGQGTIGLELLEAVPEMDVIVVPIGGGGLIGGIATAVKARAPHVRIFGVQTQGYPSMVAALKGETLIAHGDTIAEGIAVKAAGRITTQIIRTLVEDIIVVDETTLEHAVALFLNVEKTVAEGAGAAALAAVLKEQQRFAGKKVVVLLSGGNMDPRLLASVIMRELVRENRIVRLHIPIADHPGVLSQVATLIAGRGGNILEVYHQRLALDMPAKSANLQVVFEARDSRHADEVVEVLRAAGFRPTIAPP